MKKSPAMYITILISWAILICLLSLEWVMDIFMIQTGFAWLDVLAKVIIGLLMVVLAIICFYGLKEIISLCFYLGSRKQYQQYIKKVESVEVSDTPKVLLIYCTMNDFDGKSLKLCMKQKYSNFETIILDDSNNAEKRKQIDDFVTNVREQGKQITVVRRENRKFFKAGALNDYLRTRDDYDYFVVLDADEVIPRNYIEKVLKYFYYEKNLGAVQAAHINDRAKSFYAKSMGLSDYTFNFKNFNRMKYSSGMLIGHGMTISRVAYESVGGFPNIIVEDTGISIKLKSAGFKIAVALNIMCYSCIPEDFLAAKKRQLKWTRGDFQAIKTFFKTIVKSKNLKWYEKFELITSPMQNVAPPLLGFVMTFLFLVIGIIGSIKFTLLINLFFVILFVAPLLWDVVIYFKKIPFFHFISYISLSILSFVGFSFSMAVEVIASMFGKKPYFNVTIKESKTYNFWEAIRYNLGALIFTGTLVAISIVFAKSMLPVYYVVIGGLSTVVLTLISNIKIKPQKYKNKEFRELEYDEKEAFN